MDEGCHRTWYAVLSANASLTGTLPTLSSLLLDTFGWFPCIRARRIQVIGRTSAFESLAHNEFIIKTHFPALFLCPPASMYHMDVRMYPLRPTCINTLHPIPRPAGIFAVCTVQHSVVFEHIRMRPDVNRYYIRKDILQCQTGLYPVILCLSHLLAWCELV